MGNSRINRKQIIKSIEDKLGQKNWSDFFACPNESYFDYILTHHKKDVVAIKINTNKIITERMIKLFVNKISTTSLDWFMMTNGKQLVIYSSNSKEYEVIDFKDFPNKKDFIKKHLVSKKYNYIYVLMGILISILLIGFVYTKYQIYIQNKEVKVHLQKLEEQEKLRQNYDNCLLKDIDLSKDDRIVNYISILDKDFKNKNISVFMSNLKDSFSYGYNVNKNYYAASTIKTLSALYLYDLAIKDELDLDTKLIYKKKYAREDSDDLKKYHYNDKITLRDLVKYAIMDSDNSAYFMLVDYIGLNNLKLYSESIGCQFYLTENDIFGTMNIQNAEKYMEELYRLISLDNPLAIELKEYFINSKHNYLSITELKIPAATKYGYYESYFHNIGIVLDNQPYIVIVLTSEGKTTSTALIKEISTKIYKLHNLHETLKKDICYEEIYGNLT